MTHQPAYTRMDVDERRLRLLDLGFELFSRHSYGELSMADVAREGKVSKALLYHYFPSKREFFRAALERALQELGARVEPDPSRPPLEQLEAGLDGFLTYVEDHSALYEKLMQSASSHAEVHELVEQIRAATAARILAGVAPGEPPPAVGTAVRAWLWFMDGACLDWVHHRHLTRDELRGLLLGTLAGALASAGGLPPQAPAPAER